ncbi:MAG: YajD family HNH nuclease [Rhodocyclaceae bacterium]|nr:YajD family HNH nuclease [Rhodocyclaceae bacterium]
MSQSTDESTYRALALKLYPHIRGRCGREFAGARLRELTVHHKDHNHDNNPPDGSNWELLCVYCHDAEHARQRDLQGRVHADRQHTPATHNPFAGLAEKLGRK